MKMENESRLHASHTVAFDALVPGIRDPARKLLRIRFDADDHAGEPRIFAIMPVADLAQLPRPLRLPEVEDGLPGTGLFFMRNADGLALYIDTDAQDRLWIEIVDNALDAGFQILEANGDLMLITNGNGDVVAPSRPAWEANDFEHIPFEVGQNLLIEYPGVQVQDHGPSIPGL